MKMETIKGELGQKHSLISVQQDLADADVVVVFRHVPVSGTKGYWSYEIIEKDGTSAKFSSPFHTFCAASFDAEHSCAIRETYER